jgi:two-component system, LytTR family, response regulator
LKKLSCIIVDDEPLAREGLATYVMQLEFLYLEATLTNAVELASFLDSNEVDLVFLDVQMPLMSGLDFLRVRQSRPMTILTTAYPQYALESYQLDVLDYLVKPITFERLFKAATKAREYHALVTRITPEASSALTDPGYFFIRCDHRYEKIFFNDILFIESFQNYISVNTTEKKYLTLLSLKQAEDALPENAFMRVHKSFIISIRKVQSFQTTEVRIGSFTIPIGRVFRENVAARIIRDCKG